MRGRRCGNFDWQRCDLKVTPSKSNCGALTAERCGGAKQNIAHVRRNSTGAFIALNSNTVSQNKSAAVIQIPAVCRLSALAPK